MNRWWQWLTSHDRGRANAPDDDRLTRTQWMTAYRIGAGTKIPRPDWMPQYVFREMLEAKSEIMYDYLVEGRRRKPGRLTETPKALPAPEFKSAVYELPHRETGPMAKFLDTQSLPAVPKPGDVARSWHKKHKTP